MKSFKNYTKQAAEIAEKQVGEQQENASEAASAEELTKQIASAYHGRSNADMLKSILAEAERSKRAGTLSNEEIESFYRNFAPMLNGFQKKQLRAVVDCLKEIEP
ncbi:MAG: hypothetical protein IJX87_04410 [Clostridia bacterium]|nr:hypothetical protein [Clostridia bacterium]